MFPFSNDTQKISFYIYNKKAIKALDSPDKKIKLNVTTTKRLSRRSLVPSAHLKTTTSITIRLSVGHGHHPV